MTVRSHVHCSSSFPKVVRYASVNLMYYRLVPDNPIAGIGPQGWNLSLPCTVGRNPDLQICIDEDSISRSHCQLLLGPDEGVQIRDLGSLNGTYVNGERIKGIHSLVPGDSLQIGSVSVRIEYASDTDPGKPPPKRVSAPNNATQPMKVIQPDKFTMHEVVEPEKKWWEFWK